MSTVSTNIRIDSSVKKQATEIFNGLGMSLSEAVNIFCRQAILRRGLPFKVEYPPKEKEVEYKPTKELLLAVAESNDIIAHPEKYKGYDNLDKMWKDLEVIKNTE